MPKLTLNKKQKLFLFTEILDKESLVKIFETTDLKWLCSRKVVLGDYDDYGWRPLFVDGDEMTSLNFFNNPGWDEILNNIDDYEMCQWCNEWCHRDEMVFRKRGFTKLCDRCDRYLKSRGEL